MNIAYMKMNNFICLIFLSEKSAQDALAFLCLIENM